MARVGSVDERVDRIDDQPFRADLFDDIAELFDDGHDVGRALDELEIALAGIEDRELSAADRLPDGKADRVRLMLDVLRLLVGDQDAGLLMLESAGQELQPEDALACADSSANEVDAVGEQSADAVIEQVDAADDAVGALFGRRGSAGDLLDGSEEWQGSVGL